MGKYFPSYDFIAKDIYLEDNLYDDGLKEDEIDNYL